MNRTKELVLFTQIRNLFKTIVKRKLREEELDPIIDVLSYVDITNTIVAINLIIKLLEVGVEREEIEKIVKESFLVFEKELPKQAESYEPVPDLLIKRAEYVMKTRQEFQNYLI
jgi:hypothetical protein